MVTNEQIEAAIESLESVAEGSYGSEGFCMSNAASLLRDILEERKDAVAQLYHIQANDLTINDCLKSNKDRTP